MRVAQVIFFFPVPAVVVLSFDGLHVRGSFTYLKVESTK